MNNYAEIARDFVKCRDHGLWSDIMLDRGTGEVWATELVSKTDYIVYHNPEIIDITSNALELAQDMPFARAIETAAQCAMERTAAR